MAHTFLSLDMDLIPQSTKDNVPTFYSGLFSNDNSRMLIDGYNDKRELVHPMTTLLVWVQWSENPQQVINDLLLSSIEYTAKEIKENKLDADSIWHVESEGGS